MPEDPAFFTCHVLSGADFTVVSGANLGDRLGDPDDLCAGDVYRMEVQAQALKLAVADSGTGQGRVLGRQSGVHHVAEGSEIGDAGADLSLLALLTFLAPEGHKVDLLMLGLGTPDRVIHVALPLEPVEPGRDHTLIGIADPPETIRLADIVSLAFARGTHITLADGRQAPVEDLVAGDRVLTRDHGAQALRWGLHRTVRAVGPYAPVVIPKDTLGNAGDLILSQHQRLFIYQHGDERLTETAELLVRAHRLVDNETVFLRQGGFVDYYTLVFDHHEVIYAECIPVESLEVSAFTLPALPEDIAAEVGAALPDLNHVPHYGTEADARIAETARERLFKRPSGR